MFFLTWSASPTGWKGTLESCIGCPITSSGKMHPSLECDHAGRLCMSSEHVHSPVLPLREHVCVKSQELWVVWQTPSAIYLVGCFWVFSGKVQKLSQCLQSIKVLQECQEQGVTKLFAICGGDSNQQQQVLWQETMKRETHSVHNGNNPEANAVVKSTSPCC